MAAVKAGSDAGERVQRINGREELSPVAALAVVARGVARRTVLPVRSGVPLEDMWLWSDAHDGHGDEARWTKRREEEK